MSSADGAKELRAGVILAGPLFAAAESVPSLPILARQAEEAGLDLVVMPDHLALGPTTDNYPYNTFPYVPTSPYLEPMTALAAAAAVTKRVELASATLSVPLRSALLLAKTCATLDLLSGGRVVLGAGTGWHEPEFMGVGVPFAGRGDRMDDTLRACRVLWRDSPASFSSPSVSFESLYGEPRPLSPDSIKIWVGGSSLTRTSRRIADYAQGWIPPPTTPAAEIAEGVVRLRESVGSALQDVAFTLRALDGDIRRSLEVGMPELREAGVTVVNVTVGHFVKSLAAAPAFFERFASAFDDHR